MSTRFFTSANAISKSASSRSGGNRLLDQHVDIGVEERTHDGCMRNSRRADTDGINLAQQVSPVRNRRRAVCERACLAACVGRQIGDADQFDPRNARIFGRVMATKGTVADDAGAERTRGKGVIGQKWGIRCKYRDL